MADIWEWSASRIAAAVRSGEVLAVEVTQAHLDRAAQVNPTVNAIVQHDPAAL